MKTKYCVPSYDPRPLKTTLLAKLEELETRCGFELSVNSAYRSKDWEISKGRSGTSSHCAGLAVDLSCTSSAQRFKLISEAMIVGFCRIGIGRTFIHLDLDDSKPQNVIFHYYGK